MILSSIVFIAFNVQISVLFLFNILEDFTQNCFIFKNIKLTLNSCNLRVVLEY